jgi:hypothetical protein
VLTGEFRVFNAGEVALGIDLAGEGLVWLSAVGVSGNVAAPIVSSRRSTLAIDRPSELV